MLKDIRKCFYIFVSLLIPLKKLITTKNSALTLDCSGFANIDGSDTATSWGTSGENHRKAEFVSLPSSVYFEPNGGIPSRRRISMLNL